MHYKTKTPASASTLTGGKATKNQQDKASLRHENSTTKRGIARGQLCFMFDQRLPNPQDLQRFGNQRATVISYLLDGKSLTQDISRYLFGVMRLASRISELRAAGWNIMRHMITVGENGARVAEYRLNLSCPRLEATP